jgi:e3 binding domain
MTAPARIAVSPYARRLARERGIPLAGLRGSGPSGRIVAADLDRPVQAASTPAQFAAIATRIQLTEVNAVLTGFATVGMPFDLDDVVLRAAACALDDADAGGGLAGAPVALEQVDGSRRWQLVLDDVGAGSLAPLRIRRLAALGDSHDQSNARARLSIRLLPPSRIRPVLMPLMTQRAMRLVLAPGVLRDAAECLLSFDPLLVDEAVAAKFLSAFQDYLEVPLRLLA